MSAMELRPYQSEARRAIHAAWDGGQRKTLLVLPTGCGKTVVFAKIAEDEVKSGERVLVLAHRGELLEQAADKIKRVTGMTCAVEKAEESSIRINAAKRLPFQFLLSGWKSFIHFYTKLGRVSGSSL